MDTSGNLKKMNKNILEEEVLDKKEKNYKVFVVGYGKSYGSWIEGQPVDTMEEADVVVLTGGEDISPKIYNEPAGRNTAYGSSKTQLSTRDSMEVAAYEQAVKLGKVIWGTCRGAQLICALNGGKLIQDMDHGSSHKIHFYDGRYSCVTNTLHHQMVYPYNLKNKEDYFVLANSYGLSTYYLDGNDRPMEMPDRTEGGIIKEPEFVYYPKTKALGIQGHPSL